MKAVIVLIALALPFGLPLFASAQQQATPQPKLIEFQMALLRKGPNWTAEKSLQADRLMLQHKAYVMSLLKTGKAVIAGPLTDESDVEGVYIFHAASADEAKAWAEADPEVKAGHLIAEMHPWWAQDVMRKPSASMELSTVYLAFLTRGPSWTPVETTEIKELQKAHLANIRRLGDMHKLVLAGPFGDDGTLRGIFLFRVGSLEEAQQLCATDPMVKAKRLAVELHPWLVPEGILP